MSQENNALSSAESEIRLLDLKNRTLAVFLAWLCPGLGHLYQGRTQKGILFFLCLVPLILGGLWMGSYWEVERDEFQIPAYSSAETPSTDGAAPNADADGMRQLFFAKDAYLQWEPGNKRLYFIPQALNAVIAVPAFIQAKLVKGGKDPLWNGAFAPPALASDKREKETVIHRPSLNELLLRLHSWFDLGSIFLAVAGLLNLLVIFDALWGPSWILPDEGSQDASEPVE